LQVQKPKPGYKLVKSFFGKYEEIPENWMIIKLKDLIEFGNQGVNTAIDHVEYVKKGYPLIKAGDIRENFDLDKTDQISTNSFKKIPENQKPKFDDILYTNIGSQLGSAMRINFSEDIAIAWNVFLMRLNEKIDSNFLVYFLNQEKIRNHLRSIATQSTMPFIPKPTLFLTSINLPPIREQQKITSILWNLDSLIQQTQKEIKQTLKFQNNLMQELFTKGISHTKFKKVKWFFGKEIEIPEEWEIVSLGKYMKIISGEYFEYNEFSESGIRVLKIDNVMYGRVDWENKTFLPVTYMKSHKDLILTENDVVLALNRPITNNMLKVAKLTKNDFPSILYQRVGKVQFFNNEDKDFFYMFFNSPVFKKILSRILIGSDQPYVKTTELLKQKIAFPQDPVERKIIAVSLFRINNKIQKQEEYKSHLENLKKGLMNKLLTGQIRVKV